MSNKTTVDKIPSVVGPGKHRSASAKKKPHDLPSPARQLAPASPTRRQRQVEGKRRSILRAALQLFSRFGLHGSSVDQIADLAEVSKTNLLYYFKSKEELYVALLEELLDSWLQPLRSFHRDQDPQEAIADYIRSKLIISRDNPEASRLFCLEMIQGAPLFGPQLSGELNALVDAKVGVISDWIAAGKLAPRDPKHLIFSLWAITQHYADFAVQVQSLTGQGLSDEEFFESTVFNVQQIVLQGIAPR